MIKENYRLTLQKRASRFQPLATEEIQKIIETCTADPTLHLVRDVVRVIANTGMMNSELGSLFISNIDFDQGWLLAGKGRSATYAKRFLPLRSKTLNSLRSLHSLSPESRFVLGDFPRRRFAYVISRLRSRFSNVFQGRLLMLPVRMNFVYRLTTAGIPLGIVKYCLGYQDPALLMSKLAITQEQKREILRRSVESFLPEL